MTETIRVGRRAVDVTHPEKVLFPEVGLTKLDLAHHYQRVAPVMLAHVRDRPLAMRAYPAGVTRPGFFLKSAPAHFPDWIPRVEVPKRGGVVTQVVVREAATLVYLAAQNVIEPHVFSSRADQPDRPDRLIIDLDPSHQRFAEVRAAARAAGDRLRDLGLCPFAMTSGSRGIHVVAPLRRGPSFTDVHRLARALAEAMVAENPDQLTLEWHTAERGSRIYVDVNRNAYAQHAIAAYGVRARPTAPVATPLRWDELSDPGLAPDGFTIATISERLDACPWAGMQRHARRLPDPTRR
ncbi:MAG: bifunctional non-ous end joining protein LigD [Solirubrobacteraceae bacterium]|nr:bifunctional non-ous end joining protein LigD [Solirubrobacteraceae bacterium]